jgi:REP element-mobilizing transposase RayT
MGDTYSQIFYHVVFAVRNREALIVPQIKSDLYRYISGIIEKKGQKLFIINGMPDHVHLLLNCKPNMNLSDLVKEIKEHPQNSSMKREFFDINSIGRQVLERLLFQKEMFL